MTIRGLERFAPNAYRPAEFSNFWALSVAELHAVDPSPKLDVVDPPEPGLRQWRVRFESFGGVEIEAYLLRPATEQPCPLVVHAHGYNDSFEVQADWARRGIAVFGFDVRGFGRSARGIDLAPEGYVLTGVESRERSILRGGVMDFLQATRAATSLLDGAQSAVNFFGFSFGGALALMAAALCREVDLVVVGQPTFGWNEERRRVSLAGSTKEINDYLQRYPWRRAQVLDTLEYFDTLHFAPFVTAPALIGIGLDDDVVPSRTVLAVANHLRCPVEVRLLPVSHSNDHRESLWAEFHHEWLDYVVKGLPDQFGAQQRQVRALVA